MNNRAPLQTAVKKWIGGLSKRALSLFYGWGRHPLLGILAVIAFSFFPTAAFAQSKEGINNTKHNLSVTGPGEIKAITETRICIFCHTPHNASPNTPLWNKAINPVSYILYSSSTMSAVPSQPAGPSRLCLSCHDGTLAIGSVIRPSEGILMGGSIAAGRPSYLGTVLEGDHPFSFSYNDAVLNPYAGLSPTPPFDLTFYGPGYVVECSTCHDPHEDAFRSSDIHGQLTGKFLVADNQKSALCIKCHSQINGWLLTTHSVSTSLINGVLPLPPKEWPSWVTVEAWGCEGCHTSHSAGGKQRLLHYAEEEKNCYVCHNGTVTQKNIANQFQKFSRHPVEITSGVHDPKELIPIAAPHVECEDCHNPHASNNRAEVAPYVSGRLEKVGGLTIARGTINPALYEYEICFKCHADVVQKIPYIPRVINNTNAQETFSLINPSFHPVAFIGKNPDVPSIPSTYEPALTVSSLIYCSDCHGDSTGDTRGPHGSDFAPILKYQYETTDGTTENEQSYALCYRCHNRTSILSDQSFSGHRQHIVDQQTPCSVCHDAHGIADDGLSGSHTHLINFDTRMVTPTPGNLYPFFTDLGIFSGSCTLMCHGRLHDNLSYGALAGAPPANLLRAPKLRGLPRR